MDIPNRYIGFSGFLSGSELDRLFRGVIKDKNCDSAFRIWLPFSHKRNCLAIDDPDTIGTEQFKHYAKNERVNINFGFSYITDCRINMSREISDILRMVGEKTPFKVNIRNLSCDAADALQKNVFGNGILTIPYDWTDGHGKGDIGSIVRQCTKFPPLKGVSLSLPNGFTINPYQAERVMDVYREIREENKDILIGVSGMYSPQINYKHPDSFFVSMRKLRFNFIEIRGIRDALKSNEGINKLREYVKCSQETIRF